MKTRLHFERETKGSVLYKTSGPQDVVQNLYVRKEFLREEGKKGYPLAIEVTVESIWNQPED